MMTAAIAWPLTELLGMEENWANTIAEVFWAVVPTPMQGIKAAKIARGGSKIYKIIKIGIKSAKGKLNFRETLKAVEASKDTYLFV